MKHFFLFAVLSVFFFSCKKDKDELEPAITILTPYLNQSFSVLDTIKVSVKVTDETKLTSVNVVLQDMNNVNVQNSVAVAVQSNSFQFQLDYILYEIHLTDGDYKLTVLASDGTNTEVTAKVIHITAIPVNTRYFYFATEVGNSTVITRYDSVFGNPQVLNFGGKLAHLESCSWYQRFYVAEEVNAPFNAYNAYNHQQTWSIQDLGGGFPYFSTLGSDGKNVLVGYWDGRLIQYDYAGNVNVNFQTGSTTYYPEFVFVAGNSCYAGMKDNLSAAKDFRRYDRYTGVQQSSYGVTWVPVGMGEKAAGEMYIVGNDNSNQAVLNIYYDSGNAFYSPLALPAGAATGGVLVDSDYFIISHSNGNIYRYQYSTNSLLVIASGITASGISYNYELNELYVSSGSAFYIYNVAPFALQLKQSFTHTGNIDDFEVVRNR